MVTVKAKIVDGGRLIVPSSFRKSMGLEKGDTVLMELHGDELHVRPAKTAIKRLQTKLRALVPEGHSVADELIADRRRAFERE